MDVPVIELIRLASEGSLTVGDTELSVYKYENECLDNSAFDKTILLRIGKHSIMFIHKGNDYSIDVFYDEKIAKLDVDDNYTLEHSFPLN